ncbi:ZmpA/ZmpB/ZmpC family metallo-endopeptidase [Gemella sp. 27098_8_149]|uniref:ZmpA/ZmpB/ZmpC family metallo-endopeptidase n=1 Tax=Gemella sp. 27098_8_149 TaxID=3003689 RepID=UPI00352C06E7
MRTQSKNNKILKFSIRKLSFGAAPVVIGALIFGSYMPTKAYASDNGINVNYTYLTENELTESEKSLIKNSKPNDLKNNETYYMVYKKESHDASADTLKSKLLPNTGESSLPLAGLGLGTAVLVVFLISKKHRNKVLSVVLIGTLGQSVVVPYHSFALENNDLVQYNTNTTITNSSELAKGVIHIDGYRYMGFFTQSDLNEFSNDFKNILPQKIKTPVEEKTVSTKQEKSLTKVGKKENTAQPKTEAGIEETKKELHKQNEQVVKPNIKYKTTPGEGELNLSINKPELRTTVEVIPFETVRKFDVTLPKGESKILNEGINGESTVFSEVSTVNGKEISKVIKKTITKQPVNKVIAVGVGISEKGEALVQPENPEGVVSEKGEALVQPEKPIGVVSEKGEALVQPENPEGVVNEKGEALVQPENPEGVVNEKGEALVRPEKPIGVVSEKGEALVQPEKPIGVVSEKGESLVQPENPTGVVSEKGEALVQPENPEGVVSEKGEALVQPEKPIGVVSEKGEPLVQPENPEGVVSEKGEPLVQPENPVKEILKEKKPPVLTLAKIEEHTLDRSANLAYTLENEDSVEIKSIVAEVRDGENVVKRLDLTTSKLKDIADNLKLYKDYIVRTTMIYNRGKVDETSVLEERPLRLDFKKVEVKNIKETSLIHVNEQGEESDSSLLNAIPENIKEYYLKVTSRDNKTTKLAIDKIEEVKVGEDWFYKVSAKAQDLVRRTSENKIEDTYSYYIAKPKPHIGDVYYDFKDLIDAMQKTPSGTFKLGADLSAVSIKPLGKSYVTQKFTGTLTSVDDKHYSIHNLGHPLFSKLENATIKNINLENVNINLPGENNVATLAQTAKGGTIENIKVTGSVTGANEVAGIVNKLDEGKMTNIAYIGKVHATGNKGWNLAGIAGDVWRGNIEKAYVDAEITGDRSRTGGIAGNISHGYNSDGIGRWGYIRNSVAKGIIDVPNSGENGGLIGKNWPWGVIENTVTMMDVKRGDVFFGSNDMDNEYVTDWVVNKNFTVTGISKGGKTHRNSHRIKDIAKDEADMKIQAMMITADKLVSTQPTVDKLNNKVSYEDEYKNIQDYQEKRAQAYRNIEKLQPFYNKDWIVNQGNKLAENSNLVTKKILSVTAMKDTEFVTDSENANKIMVHYAYGTKELFNISAKESQVAQVKEYSIENLGGIVYTPNIVIKNRDALEAKVKELLLSVELQSQAVRNILEKRDTKNDPTANSEARQNGYIRDLFLEESFKEVRDNIDKFVKKLVENEEHQLNEDESAKLSLIKKIEKNKTNIMLALTYLNRYYGIKYNGVNIKDMNIKDMMTFKPDFYGKNVDVLDRLIKIGSKESYIKGDRTYDAYREVIASGTGKANLHEFLNYNMKLFTADTDLNDWFKHATEKNVYISEPTTTTQDFVNKKHRAYDGLNNFIHGRMILPLLTLKNAHIFLISTYNTLAYSSFEKYGKYTEEERNKFKAKIDEVANAQQRYLDFWSRLALSSVRNKLLKSDNMVPTAVWDNQNYSGGSNRYGFANNGKVVAPVRELYGPTWRYHNTNGSMGAMARIYGRPYEDDAVFFMVTDMVSQFGISAFTHETTHVNDRMLYYGGNWHREGTDLEAYAQGMLQTPDSSTTNGEYGALGLNMAYVRPNNGDQWYNYDPNKLRNRQEIDAYMKRYNEAMMMLDHLEADAVISKGLADNSKWFRKIDKEYRYKDSFNELLKPNQWDKVRDLKEEEKTKQLTSINDLIDNNFATKHGVGNGRYRPEDLMPNSAYVNVNMMAGIYGGNSSDGAPGSLSFKHNAFRMWGYYGYEDGFISYVSNKYKDAANKEKLSTLSDKYIIKKVSKGAFETLEAWKKHWYGEILEKAKHGFAEIDIDNVHITSYEQLQQMFKEVVQKDLDQMTKTGKEYYGNTVSLKTKVFKQLLKVTDGFSENLFK